jgi:hypothetical protein
MEQEQLPKGYNKPETITSLAKKYGVTPRTFRKWIRPLEGKIRIYPRVVWFPKEVRVILEFLDGYEVEGEIF